MSRPALMLILGLILSLHVSGQISTLPHPENETGHPYISYYSPETYEAYNQNWSILQDTLGLMYFGNGKGLLIYDGVSWDLINLPNQGPVFALALDHSGRIYAGGTGEIGYLEADSIGVWNYVSLLPRIDAELPSDMMVRHIQVAMNNVYFQCQNYLIRWDGHNASIIHGGERKFTNLFEIKGSVYVASYNEGILEITGDSLSSLIDHTTMVGQNATILLPFDQEKLLIATYQSGLYIYDGNRFSPFQTCIDAALRSARPYCGTVLSDSTFAIGTQKDGMYIIDRAGNVRLHLTDNTHMQERAIYALQTTKQGHLWAGMANGLAKIEYPTPFTYFDEKNGLEGHVHFITRMDEKMIAGTEKGLFELKYDKKDHKVYFDPVTTVQDRVWNMLEYEGTLILGLGDGLYQWDQHSLTQINRNLIYELKRSKQDPRRIFVGHTHGISSIYDQNGRWIDEGNFSDTIKDIHGILETRNGELWLKTHQNKVYQVQFGETSKTNHTISPVINSYTMTDGLPDDLGTPYNFDGQIIYSTYKKNYITYRFDWTNQSFIMDKNVFPWSTPPGMYTRIRSVDPTGNVWFDILENGQTKEKKVAWRSKDQKYTVFPLRESRIKDHIQQGFFYDSIHHVVWYGGGKKLIRHDLNTISYSDTASNALVRKVFYNEDSLLFAGIDNPFTHSTKITLPYKNNRLRFHVASTNLLDESSNKFQYQLAGLESDWPEWTDETYRDYNNIPPGDYTFSVRSKDLMGHMSDADKFYFNILPPWYSTWWAYLFYVLAFIAGIHLLVRWRSRKLALEKQVLEKLVLSRTYEVQQKNHQLHEQTLKLKELDHMKSRFFANVSHEFRTPLTLIQGPVEQAIQEPDKPLGKEDIRMVRRNTDRLMRLVNQLLDLAKLDAHALELDLEQGDIFKHVRIQAASFQSLAAHHHINFHTSVLETEVNVLFDSNKLESILSNLLSNAFKFTPEGGQVSLKAEIHDKLFWLSISNSGEIISEDRLPFIFDRFYQAGSDRHIRGGTGIGLALTRELLELMGGSIHVESTSKEGTTFTVEFPVELTQSSAGQPATVTTDEGMNDGKESIPPQTSDDDTGLVDESNDKSVILIVEDNADMRQYISDQLKVEYKTLTARNGHDGWEMALKDVPDLVITDLMMPVMDGIKLCEIIKSDERTSHIPVIMLTALADKSNRNEGLQTGADSYLTKPFDVSELMIRVYNLISQRALLREKYRRMVLLEPSPTEAVSLDEQFIHKLRKLLDERYVDSNLAVTDMQEALAMGKTQLYQKMQALTGQSPGEFLRTYRLKKAAQLISRTGDQISQIAYAVGFNNLSYFARCFRNQYGMNPSEYKDKQISSEIP